MAVLQAHFNLQKKQLSPIVTADSSTYQPIRMNAVSLYKN